MRSSPVLLSAIAGSLFAQSLLVAPTAVKLQQVAGGPTAVARVTIAAGSGEALPFTATSTTPDANDPWIALSAPSGTTPAALDIGVVNWRGEARAPGAWRGEVTIKAGGASRAIPVEWEVRAAGPPPRFTYLAGPNGCAAVPGYADPAFCKQAPIPNLAGAPGAGTSYIDPNFGARVRVLTGPGAYHNYATPSPLSAHSKYLLSFLENGTFDVIEAATGRIVVQRVPCTQSNFWDAADDEVFYYFQGDAAIVKYDIRQKKGFVLIDYAKQRERFHELVHGGTGDTSKDNWISFWAPDEKQVCALDINALKTYCADYSASQRRLPYGDIDFTLISKGVDRVSGKRYVMIVAPPAMGVFSVDLAAGKLRPEFRGGENIEKPGNHDGICDPGERCFVGSHIDTLEDSSGTQYLVMNADTSIPCEFALSTYQLNKGADMVKQVELGGGRRKVMTLWRCGPGWVDEHVGCAKAAPYCVISTQGVPHGRNDPSPPVTPHGGELIVMRENGAEIRRVALSRSVLFTDAGDNGYWSTPRAALSSDGALVVADSNFGVPNGQRVTLVDTGFGK